MRLMRVQLDRYEDNGLAVLSLLPDGRRSFDMPMELLPEGARPGDVFTLSFQKDVEEGERLRTENQRLMDELLGRDER